MGRIVELPINVIAEIARGSAHHDESYEAVMELSREWVIVYEEDSFLFADGFDTKMEAISAIKNMFLEGDGDLVYVLNKGIPVKYTVSVPQPVFPIIMKVDIGEDDKVKCDERKSNDE